MGVYTGLYPRHWSSRLLQAVSLIGVSLPTFLIGILLILVFCRRCLHWLPSFGRGETVTDRLVDDQLPDARRASRR